MKSLNTYLNEKLLINKNFKVNVNDKFYEKFKDVLKTNSDIGWWKTGSINAVIPMKLSIEDKNAVNNVKEFFNTDDFVYSRSVSKDFEKEINLYYDILKFIANNKDNIEFFYINEKMNDGDYLIYLFETGKIKVAVWGHENIVSTNRGTIAFQYIK